MKALIKWTAPERSGKLNALCLVNRRLDLEQVKVRVTQCTLSTIMVWVSEGGIKLIRILSAKANQKGKTGGRRRKKLNQHFLEFTAHAWTGKSKRFHVKQSTPVCHEAGRTGHSVSRYRVLNFLACLAKRLSARTRMCRQRNSVRSRYWLKTANSVERNLKKIIGRAGTEGAVITGHFSV